MLDALKAKVLTYETNEDGRLGFKEGDALNKEIEGHIGTIGSAAVEALCARVIRCRHYCN